MPAKLIVLRTCEACRAALTALLLISARAQPAAPFTLDIETHRFVLDNGLTVIVAPDPHSEIVAVRLLYRVGSRDEQVGATGLAHLFEHMMFRGARRHGPKQFDAVLERAGGYGNAYTRQDLTAYVTEVPPQSLATVLDLESDRMVGLDLNEAMLAREQQVVLQERRETLENRPEVLLSSLLMASLFHSHPNRWPILGWVADIEAATVDSCRAFYRRHYAPNNAVLVLAGAVALDDARQLVRNAFDGLPRVPGERAKIAAEPARAFSSRILLEREAPAPMLLAGFVGPRALDPDHAVLDLLAQILVRGRTARLVKRLVRQDHTVAGVDIRHDWTLDAEPLAFALTLAPQQAVEPVIDALFDELGRLARDGVGDDELARARTGASVALLRSLATAPDRATVFGELEVTTGDHRACLALPARYAQIDSARVQEVCARVFARDRVALAELRPRRSEAGR